MLFFLINLFEGYVWGFEMPDLGRIFDIRDKDE